MRAVGGGRAVARLLDVGTGAGVLLPYFMSEVSRLENKIGITQRCTHMRYSAVVVYIKN